MEEVRLWEIANHTGNITRHDESSEDMTQQKFYISDFCFAIAKCSVYFVMPPAVFFDRRYIIS